ncbi:MAG: MaoC/PaaZ C-terminal domain-containing protein [Dehalococcoidia bacterium]
MKYFEDFDVGERIVGPESYLVTKEEILEFGRRWDPAPFHADEEAAKETMFGGIVAPGAFLLAIQTYLMHKYEDSNGRSAALARLETDELRFLAPVRPGDILSFEMECVDKRESQGRPDCGIVTDDITLKNQNGEVVMTLKNTILVAKRPAEQV